MKMQRRIQLDDEDMAKKMTSKTLTLKIWIGTDVVEEQEEEKEPADPKKPRGPERKRRR